MDTIPVGNLDDVQYANGIRHQYQYNALNRLTNLTVRNTSAEILLGYAYTLNTLGYRENVIEATGRAVDYTYDAIGRLLRETIANDPQLIMGSAGYEYDKAGNRLQRNSNIRDVLAQVLSYDDNDRLESDTSDANGNTIASSGGTDVYDYRNRLIRRIQLNGEKIDYVYDADGNRIAKTIRAADESLIERVKYIVDSRNPTGYAQTFEEWGADGTNALTLCRTFTYGLDLIRQQLWNDGAWQTRYYLYDGHGSVRGLTDLFGNVTDTYTYDAFGIELSRTGDTVNNYRYCGEYFDEDLGLYYLRARHMNPETGRFWTMDTFAGFHGEPLSLHKYLYAHANPVMLSDPSGNISLTELMVNMSIGGAINVIMARSRWNASYWRQPWDEILADIGGDFAIGAAAGALGPLGRGIGLKVLAKTTMIPALRPILASGIGGSMAGGGLSLFKEFADYYVNAKKFTLTNVCQSSKRVMTGTIIGFGAGTIVCKFDVVRPATAVYAFPTVVGHQIIRLPIQIINLSGVAGVAGVSSVESIIGQLFNAWSSFLGDC